MRDGFGSAQGTDAPGDPRRLRSAVGRAVVLGAAGAVVTAGTFFSSGTAQAAESAVIEKCSGTTDSTAYGQEIVASPSALAGKVEQATLGAFPLRFDIAKQAREQFENTGSIELGTVTEETQTFSGKALAEAFAPQIESLPALEDKGYNPINQIVGYIMSGDPTYITSYKSARSLIMKVERDELVEELLKAYIEHNAWE